MRAGGGRDGGTRGGVIGIVATVRERWLWPDEAAMFDPLAVRGGAGRVGGMRVGPRLRSVENPWETSVGPGGGGVGDIARAAVSVKCVQMLILECVYLVMIAEV